MMACGENGSPPTQILPGFGDEAAAMACAWGVTAALYAREKTGKGQVVDTSLMGGVIASLGLIMSAPAILNQEFPREIRAEAGNPIYNHYRCQDDKWLVLAHLQPDRYWPKICKALGLEELENDPRFSSVEARSANSRELIALFDERFASKNRDEWIERLREWGCICTPIQTPTEVIEDPQALANNYVIDIDHPKHGSTKMVGFPWDFSETPASCKREAPELGQHTEEILLEIGYTQEAIDEMRGQEII
jgi:crotonobetainyl-CoA:carnitine CoA-transferase CaiB-like acyl-CoA transferase